MGGGDLVSMTDKSTRDKLFDLRIPLSHFVLAIELEEELASVYFSKLGESLEGGAAS